MVVLCRINRLAGSSVVTMGGKNALLLQFGHHGSGRVQLLCIMIKDGGAVLAAHIVPLSVQGGGVVGGKNTCNS
jgi:hypothetical protein